jgi:hypothetical protein
VHRPYTENTFDFRQGQHFDTLIVSQTPYPMAFGIKYMPQLTTPLSGRGEFKRFAPIEGNWISDTFTYVSRL